MSNITIPNSEGQIRQDTRGDTRGELNETFNIDLTSTPGKIKSSKRLISTMNNTQMGNNDILAIELYKGVIYALGENLIATIGANRNVRQAGNWTASTDSGKIGNNSDTAVFNDLLVVVDGADMNAWNGSTWDTGYWQTTLSGTALDVATPHVLHVHKGGAETLFVTDQNVVRYYNTSALHDSITLQPDMIGCSITSGIDTVWVGTFTESSSHAYVYSMKVGNTIASQAYKIDGQAVLSMETINNTPYIVTDKGHIQKFNGVGFVTVASFPFAFKSVSIDGVITGTVAENNIERAIHPKGMKADQERLLISINTNNELIDQLASNPTDDDDEFDNIFVDTRSPSGVWEFDTTTGVLNHRYSLTLATTDMGALRQQKSSPIHLLGNQFSRILVGGRIDTTECYLYAEDVTNAPQSWFITREINSKTVEDTYEAIYHKAKTMASGESIITQYRKTKRDTIYGTANWTGTDTFVVTDDWSGIAVGDLVRVSHGYASGDYANVVSVTPSSSTYTVVVDREIGINTETSYVYSDNFKKLGVDQETGVYNDEATYTSGDGEYKRVGVGETSPWIQYMVILKGDIEYRQFISKGNSKTEL